MAKRRADKTPPPPPVPMDLKEKDEREEATKAYMGEDERHFVDFMRECVKTSVSSMLDIRTMQAECWRVFNEEEPYNFALKEDWQSRVTYPKPYKLVQAGSAAIRKIFEMEFLSAENKLDPDGAIFWKELLMNQLGRNYANFPICFADATGMALAIGTSMEMIPYWIPGKGLRYSLIEPGKIHRDPNALSRHPQSGEYWIHQEHMGYHQLKAMEKTGQYVNVPDAGPGGTYNADPDPNVTQEEIARRKNMLYVRDKYHHDILTQEFWGTVLSRKGEILMPTGRYTVAADKVIGLPETSPYPTLRWPGTGFSALPHLLRFDGRGLIQGIRSLWYLMCNLMSLHADHLNWAVNPMMEMDINSLVDQSNTDIFPGKVYQTHGTTQGQQVVRAVDIRSQVSDILAYLNKLDMIHQDGGLVDYATMGSPGYRAEVTATETAQNLDQSMVLVGSMGKNVEDGALDAIMAAAETIAINMTYDELKAIMGPEAADRYRVGVSDEFPTGLDLPKLGSGTFHVSGISGVMKDQEVLKKIETLILPLFNSQQYGNTFLPYLHPYETVQAIINRATLRDEGILVTKEQAQAIDAAQQQQQEAAIGHQAGTEQANAAAAGGMADKNAALADKAAAEAQANQSQAGLFDQQAGAVAAQPPAEPGGGV